MRNLAKTNRPNQNLVFNALMLLCIGAFLISCGDDDEDNAPGSPSASDPNFGVATTDEGCSFELEFPDGSTTTITGSGMTSGWQGGNLLGSNYFRQARVFTDLGSMDFRLSMPGGTPFIDSVQQTHSLRTTLLLLENTPNLNELYPELFFQFSDTINGNGSGVATIYKDAGNAVSGNFSIFGTVDAEFQTTNTSFRMTGSFWSRDYDW
ncbi:MAG: hypothetical protein LC664_04690 [Flavobacteriales bacterium]|nr:hypothetical protein [Flavobacteriales bacterium]